MEPLEQQYQMYAKLLPHLFSFEWFLTTVSLAQTVLWDREMTNECGRMWSWHIVKYVYCLFFFL